MVLITPEPLSVKLVELKAAIPLVEPSALALLMVTVPLLPVLLARVNTPDCESIDVTPPPAPPVQDWKLRSPKPSDSRQSPLLPLVVGRVSVKLLAGSVAGACSVTV